MRPYNLFNNSMEAQIMLQNPSEVRTIMRTTIAILVEACPMSLFLADDTKKTPLHFARALDFDKDFALWAYHIGDFVAGTAAKADIHASAKKPLEMIEVSKHKYHFDAEADMSELTLPF
jgi:hypothetical protein